MQTKKPTPSEATERADNELGKGSSKVYRRCYEEACLARSLKISVLPPNENGTKSPLNELLTAVCTHPACVAKKKSGQKEGWTHRQHKRAGESILQRWYLDEHRVGIGYVCGENSNGLLLIEFEGVAVEDGIFDEFLNLAEEVGLGDLITEIQEGYEDESPSGGIHWLVYCDHSKSEKLATKKYVDPKTGKAEWPTLIETKGEGGFAISAPSSGKVHPSGRPYRRLQGGLETIVYLNPEEIDALFALARQFDQKPHSEVKCPRGSSSKVNGWPSDDFNERASWNEILEPHGWEALFTSADGREYWCRPGKEPKGTSATISPDGQLLYVFSTSTVFEANKAYRKFVAYAVLNHSDDERQINWAAAAQALGVAGNRTSGGIVGQGAAVVTVMSDVQVKSVAWLWEDRIPFGNLTNLPGDPGLGKSLLLVDLAARVTTGKPMPFTLNFKRKPSSVLLLTGEDDLANTVKPRLIAAGADTNRVIVLEGISHQPDGQVTQMISIPDDIPMIKEQIIKYGVGLVIVDPINAFLADRINSNQDHSIRRALSPLKMLAEETGVAIVTISHLNKNSRQDAQYRVNGSIGTIGASRSVLLVALDPEDEESRILAGIKANLSPIARSLKFHIEQGHDGAAAHIVWDGFSNLTKDDLLNKKPAKAMQIAMEFLENALADGPVKATELESAAESSAISHRTLQRASKLLGVLKEHIDSPNGYWEWSLPNDEGDDESEAD